MLMKGSQFDGFAVPDNLAIQPEGALSQRGSRTVWRLLTFGSGRRRAQLLLMMALTVASAVAELVTIGAVLPVLAIAASPANAVRIKVLGPLLVQLSALTGGSLILAAALLLGGAAIVATFIRLTLAWSSNQFTFGLMQDLVMAVFSRALHQPYHWYVQQNSSSMVAALDKITQTIFGVVAPVIQAATAAFTAICLVAFLFLINPMVALVAAVSLGMVYVAMTFIASSRLKRVSGELARFRTARVQAVQESLGGIRDILLEHSQPVFYDNLFSIEDRQRRNLVLAGFLQLAPRAIVEGVAVVLIAGLAVWFSTQPGGLLAAVPVLGALAIGAQRLLPMAQAVYFGWAGYSTYADSIADVFELLEMPVEAESPDGGAKPIPFERELAMRDVTFRYADGTAALTNVNLAIGKGERVGIVGKTGSGKSTLVDVLMALLAPSEGALLVDGVRVTGPKVGGWRARIAHVPQSIFLRDASIAENIAFGVAASEIDDAKIRDAADRAGLLDFIETLPRGFVTEVGERGIRLSGGQRQRIGIARALYQNAELLVLDEATSALDTETEAAVMESVKSLSSTLTMVLIAHRLSTVAICDRVYRLEDGRIVAEGSYEEVVGGERAPRKARSKASR
jgi:ABC-type multidrug transport system fused ATPase/permease subunit